MAAYTALPITSQPSSPRRGTGGSPWSSRHSGSGIRRPSPTPGRYCPNCSLSRRNGGRPPRAGRPAAASVRDRAGRGGRGAAAADRGTVTADHDLGRGPHRVPRRGARQPAASVRLLRRLPAAAAAAYRAIRVVSAVAGRGRRIRHFRCGDRGRGGAIRLPRERGAHSLRLAARAAGGGGPAASGRAARDRRQRRQHPLVPPVRALLGGAVATADPRRHGRWPR